MRGQAKNRKRVNALPSMPLPTKVVSNGEYWPHPKTAKQQALDDRLLAWAQLAAERRGISRRAFLLSAAGMASAFFFYNKVYGMPFFAVGREALEDDAAAQNILPKEIFIFDVQTHHVDVQGEWLTQNPTGRIVATFLRAMRKQAGLPSKLEDLSRFNYAKEIFLDSDTTMAILSGVPSTERRENMLPVDQMAKTRDEVNAIAGSQRMLSHGLLAPNRGEREFEEMAYQVSELKIAAWKMYPGAELDASGWWLDDEKVAYPFFERSRELGIETLCIHKGLPLGIFNEKYCRVRDVPKAVQDFPDMNFVIYHSGHPWSEDLAKIAADLPQARNLYAEIGSTFAMTVVQNPVSCAHVLGRLLKAFGPDRVLWGTDSIWWGSPQWQITAFWNFRIPDELIEKEGYPQLTEEVKKKILGLNAAKLFGVDPTFVHQQLKLDQLERLKSSYREDPLPTGIQYGSPTYPSEAPYMADARGRRIEQS